MGLKRLLVANRGEIALRIIRAARQRGLPTVLAASAADRDSLPAREADQVVVIGPAPARRSYLDPKLIVHAAKATGCDALHPGYGFLSERAVLARFCAEEDITFIGPVAETIEAVGDKLAARRLAEAAGVPMVPGTPALPGVDAALAAAETLGYPVVTKASAGGGGRGMVVAANAAQLTAGFAQASAEAQEAFGDGTLFLERYVETARHVEVQVLGDGRGTVVQFGERDCSIQRRYQKMIEESPAAILPEEVRSGLHAAAVALLSGINYRNAGTVEFLYDVERRCFYFIEVNARIQVEHPVSEMVTNQDLIGLQLAVAEGDGLPVTQDQIRVSGHAIEARIIAEDPQRNFAPSPGRISRWQPPQGDGVRLDSTMHDGAMVSPFYDSMIAKLIVHGRDRQDAVGRLSAALDDFAIGGIATNLPLLKTIVRHPDYVANRIDTRWLERSILPDIDTLKAS